MFIDIGITERLPIYDNISYIFKENEHKYLNRFLNKNITKIQTSI